MYRAVSCQVPRDYCGSKIPMSKTNFPQTVASKMPVETRNFIWEIANFDKILSSTEIVNLQSFHFEMGSSIGLPTKWTCYLNCQQQDGKDWIGVFISLDKTSSGSASKVLATCLFKIGDGKYFSGRTITQDMITTPGYGFQKMTPLHSNQDRYVLPLRPDGSLVLDIEVSLFNFDATQTKTVGTPISTLVSAFESKSRETLHQDLLNMFKNPCPDSSVPMMVRVISSDHREFSVNRGILGVRSPVFCSMFETTMREANEGVVKIDDISGCALEVVLQYMHTGTLAENWKETGVVEELTYAAGKYMLEDLKEFMDQVLGLVCTAQNCGKLLSLASKLNMSKAEQDLMEFCKNQLKQASRQDRLIF